MQVAGSSQAGSEQHIWRRFLARTTLALGLLLLASAALCWVAANWPLFSKIQRLSSVQVVLGLVAALAVALYARGASGSNAAHGRAAVLGLATVLLGGLLALIGQTYQTGADNWELFAAWAVLMLPWALAARSQGLWLLWALLVNAAVILLLGERVLAWWGVFDGPGFPSLLVAGLNLVLLGLWEFSARRWQARTGVGPRVLVLLAVGALVLALVFGGVSVENLGSYTGLAWVLATVGLAVFYTRLRRDLLILAMLAAGVICVSLRVMSEWLLDLEPGIWVVLPLAGLLMGEAVLAARWLRRLAATTPAPRRAAEPMADAEPAGISAGAEVEPAVSAGGATAQVTAVPADRAAAPWFIQGLLGFSAWLASLLLLVFLGVSGLIISPSGALVTGLVLCAIGVAMVRAAEGPFWRQCATALAFSGQILVMAGLADANSPAGAAVFVLALAIVIYVFGPDAILRFLSGLTMVVAVYLLTAFAIEPGDAYDTLIHAVLRWLVFDDLRGIALWLPASLLTAWVAALAFLLNPRLPARRHDALLPLAWSFALAAQASVVLAAGVPVWQLPALWQTHAPSVVYLILVVLLPVAAAVAMLHTRRQVLGRGVRHGVPLGLALLAGFWLSWPGVAYALTWLLLGFGLRRARLFHLGQAAVLLCLVFYYYRLDTPLLYKATLLAGAGVLLLLLRVAVWAVPRLRGTATPRAAGPAQAAPWRAGLIAAGLLLCLGAANTAIWQREQLLAHGQVVRLELASRDPRSLLQGDYMDLRFAAAQAVGTLQESLPAAVGVLHAPLIDAYVVLRPDDHGVAQPVRVQAAPQPHDAQEVVLRYRLRADGVRIVTNAYFFPEGQGDRYVGARYGELRVDDSGTGLLVNLLDVDFKPL
ncbi:GDYXXLXY domain-containing protein [Bordetella sp. LUAb4]|uniref:GDYXXLXY domain-containing protein n=1 Tax=Bordetella sp. LUAb4 TaxID=2843195 RepID=UPI001E30A3D8|nr:GDYXXLXY domain-containing protein [Bordetella sp. LUAb4]